MSQPMILSWCPGQNAPCDPCAQPNNPGDLYILGEKRLSLNQFGAVVEDPNGTYCHLLGGPTTVDPNHNLNDIISFTVTVTQSYQDTDPKTGVPFWASIGYTLTSRGHYGGWYNEFPGLGYCELPFTILAHTYFLLGWQEPVVTVSPLGPPWNFTGNAAQVQIYRGGPVPGQ